MCKHSFIIETGAARIFHFKDGKDITSHFAFEGEAITAIDSLLHAKKSKYNIELLEDSILFSVSYEDMENLCQKSIIHERFGRLFLQQVYIDLVERIED
ncbi:MAG: CRP-like cAMP-binding protein [Maribacter sp.]